MPRLLSTALGLVAVAALAFAAAPAGAQGNPKENAKDARILDLQARADVLLLVHPKLVFNTAGTFTGDLIAEAATLGLGDFTGDGLGAADAICQDEAEDAGLPLEFKAWLLTSQVVDISGRLTQNAFGYALVDETPIADDFADLIDGDGITNPIDLDAAGNPVAASNVWTNVKSNNGGSDTADCFDWSSSSIQLGRKGRNDRFDTNWTQSGTDGCEATRPLYCFQQ